MASAWGIAARGIGAWSASILAARCPATGGRDHSHSQLNANSARQAATGLRPSHHAQPHSRAASNTVPRGDISAMIPFSIDFSRSSGIWILPKWATVAHPAPPDLWSPPAMGASPYHVHRLALRPFTAVDRARWEGELARLLADRGEGPFIDFIVQQGLAPLWHGLFPKGTGPFSAKGAATLRAEAIRAAQIYLLQKAALGEITGILDGQGIEHLSFKGAHLREILYPEPHTRTACDIDLLVNPEDSGAAIRALLEAGYGLEVSPVSISHEATLLREQIGIDIHWDILRPGRTRRPMTGEMIARRQWAGDHWGPCAEHSLFVMLVHPVITKYATSPQATLNRLVDILLFMDKVGVEWDGVLARLAESGLKTAAWI